MQHWQTPDLIALHAGLRPDRLACVDLATGRRWSYAELDRAVRQMAGVLAGRLGIRRGGRVAVLARNSADQLILQQAVMRLGAILAPLNWRLARQELAPILADCAPSLLVTDGIAQADPPAGCVAMTMANLIALRDAGEPARPAALPAATDPCVILYTSGTSGVPKGVVLTGQTMFFTAINFGVLADVSGDSVFLLESPMFHVIGLVTSIWPPLKHGATILVSNGFDPLATNDRLADPALGITHYFCVPQMADALRQAANFAPAQWSLKALFTGGAPNPRANILWWLNRGIRMVDGFGMTEAGTILGMSLEPELITAKAGSVGLPGPGTAVRIVDDEGREAPDGEPGEILVAGPNVTPGYWNRPEERERAFTPDGWLRTGDVGCRDADGFVTIVDRRKDMFISGGENVYPVEVETVLLDHPAVAEAAVIGIPDKRWGEVGRAYVVLKSDVDALPEAADLAAHCEGRLARYKIPKEFRFVEALPRTGSGKLQKSALKQQALAELPLSPAPGAAETAPR
ncbi:AMP-binding protein [Pseudochelatococcus lubricantis]|uniref:AMP-binding protein n=1 Tax=Pseudochelatococcus lubricantis TaxID=1538102 RepID=UPI0035EDE2D6